MKKTSMKKGFTLVELLITIVLLGIIGGIVIYNMTNISRDTKENDYDRFIAEIKSAASVYADMYPEAFNELYVSRAYIYITLGDLVNNGVLDEDKENPYTKEKIDLKELVKANLDSTNGAVTFEYPVTETENEQVLVAMSDYVVWGESYDCMRGIGTYELSLSDEEGNLIDLTGKDDEGVSNIEKYNFTCTLPKVDAATYEGTTKVAITQPGNYDITYNWISESGVKKQATRILRVLAKVVPSFKANVNDYDFIREENDLYNNNFVTCSNCDSENFYQTSMNSSRQWDTLQFKPYIEGADPATTTYKLSKKIMESNDRDYDTSFKYMMSDYSTYNPNSAWIQADDGDKLYKIEAIVQGHYDQNYSYHTEGYGRFKAELTIPEQYITTNGTSSWSVEKTYFIEHDTNKPQPTVSVQSPVGIRKYEFKLSTEENLGKRISPEEKNLFDKSVTVPRTEKLVSVYEDASKCVDAKAEYTTIFFRATNNEGYTGKWTRYGTKLTNELSTLFEKWAIDCDSTSLTCCENKTYEKKDTKLDEDIKSCLFKSKEVFFSYKGEKYVVLERFEKDATLLATLDTDTGTPVNPLSVKKDRAEQMTCDMLVWKDYTHNVANEEIQRELKRWVGSRFNNTGKIVEPVFPYKYESKYDKNISSANKTSAASTFDENLLKKYGKAVVSNSTEVISNVRRDQFWLLDRGSSPFTVKLDKPRNHNNESTTRYNTFFYYARYNSSGQKMEKKHQYGGQYSFVKPIVRVHNLRVCQGEGTRDNPFIIA